MRIAVTGSIATDHLMTFPGRFTDQLIADKLDKVSLSFLVTGLEIRRGGVAANIAFGLGCLGLHPLLVGTVGSDFADYQRWLEDHGVDTSMVRESTKFHTARFVGTTDADLNQIASFYPGAMSEDASLDLSGLAGLADLVLIGAGDPAAMLSLTTQCRENHIPFAADTSQQLASPRRRSDPAPGGRRGVPVQQRVRGVAHRAQERLERRRRDWPGGRPGHHARRRPARGSTRTAKRPVLVGPGQGRPPG